MNWLILIVGLAFVACVAYREYKAHMAYNEKLKALKLENHRLFVIVNTKYDADINRLSIPYHNYDILAKDIGYIQVSGTNTCCKITKTDFNKHLPERVVLREIIGLEGFSNG